MNGITISDRQEHTHTHIEILTCLRAFGEKFDFGRRPDVSY